MYNKSSVFARRAKQAVRAIMPSPRVGMVWCLLTLTPLPRPSPSAHPKGSISWTPVYLANYVIA